MIVRYNKKKPINERMKLLGQPYWKSNTLATSSKKNLKSHYASDYSGSLPTFRIQRLRRHYEKKSKRKQSLLSDSNNHATLPSTTEENTYFQRYQNLMKTIYYTGDNFFSSDIEDQIIERENNWLRLSTFGKPLVEYYSWAIPCDKVLDLFLYFSPIIEIGAGKGYWAYLLKKKFGDKLKIRCFDRHPNYRHSWTMVEAGTPSSIFQRQDIIDANPEFKTLFLSYPDEDSELGSECLSYFQGDYIIHVGELITTGSFARQPQTAFGRTTTGSFQVELMEKFHCIASIPLPNLPFCNDHLTIWKRTQWILGRGHYVKHVLQAGASLYNQNESKVEEEEDEVEYENDNESEIASYDDGNDSQDSHNNESQASGSNQLDYWANIPLDERYSPEWICPAYQFLRK